MKEYFYYKHKHLKPAHYKQVEFKSILLMKGIETNNSQQVGLFESIASNKVQDANLICEHIFDLLGSESVKITALDNCCNSNDKGISDKYSDDYIPINWQLDLKSNYQVEPNTFFRSINVYPGKGIDLKVPWELSRFQHLIILGQAYHLSKNNKYVVEIISQINDWIKNNPIGFGVNWICVMDISIRIINWVVAIEYCSRYERLSRQFMSIFIPCVYEQSRFIYSHLENKSKWTTNHYLADITGLFFVSVYYPFFDKSEEWRSFALDELCKEIEKQIYDDGCTFESSTSYHRLSMEMFFYAALLGERAGIEFSDEYKEKLKKMFEFSLYCIKPNGMIPQIGDNDSGRLLKFSKRKVLDHSYLLSFAAIYFKDSNFKLTNMNFDEEALWIFGMNGKEIWDQLPYREGMLKSRCFTDAGWYIIRWDDDYCFISCGRNGGDGWHAHNDKLSFELMIDGQDIIVDPGTYVYTSYPEERNKFRSTSYHNTIKFDGYEQNKLSKKNMFYLPDRVKINKAELKEEENSINFKGEINYADITHKRNITYDKYTRKWQIDDLFQCPDNTGKRLLFHLAPAVKTDGKYLFLKNTGKKIASIEVVGFRLQKEKYDYSPEYGVKVEAECLVAHIPSDKDIVHITTFIRRP